MNKIHNDKVRMYSAVKQLLEKNRTLWEEIVALAAVITSLFKRFDEIDGKRIITEADSTGATEDKNGVEENYIEQIIYIAGALHSHGFNAKDANLMAQTDLMDGELQNMRETEHGVTPAEVEEFESLRASFKTLIGSPRTTIAERKAANERIVELIKECDKIFKNQLDKLMVRYKRTNNEFYKAYLHAKLLVSYGVHHEKTDETTTADE